VLCDNVAILKHGRLAHAGSLEELRARESSLIEVIATGADGSVLQNHLPPQTNVTATPSGLRIEVSNEREVDGVIEAIRIANGKLISVQPVRQSLEDLFLE
jgi:ABC-type multidrug transport system ATPase subunit